MWIRKRKEPTRQSNKSIRVPSHFSFPLVHVCYCLHFSHCLSCYLYSHIQFTNYYYCYSHPAPLVCVLCIFQNKMTKSLTHSHHLFYGIHILPQNFILQFVNLINYSTVIYKSNFSYMQSYVRPSPMMFLYNFH